jgi:hypothetical protein
MNKADTRFISITLQGTRRMMRRNERMGNTDLALVYMPPMEVAG